MLAIVQGALWAHAGAIAQAAADHGAEVAAAFGSDGAAGERAAEGFATDAGTIRNAVATAIVGVDPDLVVMQVTGSYPTVFGVLEISATATTTRERLP